MRNSSNEALFQIDNPGLSGSSNLGHLKLYSCKPSPFARRVHLALRRLGKTYDFETVGNLFPPSPDFLKVNPLGLIPALEVPREDVIIDSNEILAWLDHKFGGVWPKELNAHWIDRRLSALSAGVMTLAVSWRAESLKDAPRLDDQRDRENAILRALTAIQNTQAFQRWKMQNSKSRNEKDLLKTCYQGSFDLAASLDYLLFRLPHLDWSNRNPELEDFLADFKENDVFMSTDPRN